MSISSLYLACHGGFSWPAGEGQLAYGGQEAFDAQARHLGPERLPACAPQPPTRRGASRHAENTLFSMVFPWFSHVFTMNIDEKHPFSP